MPFPRLDQLAQQYYGTPFPREDSAGFESSRVDPAIRKETDGGLVFTRKQYLRTPALMIVTSFQAIQNNYKSLLDALWLEVGGGANSFAYENPLSPGQLFTMRFDAVWTTKYQGTGIDQTWNVTGIKLREI